MRSRVVDTDTLIIPPLQPLYTLLNYKYSTLTFIVCNCTVGSDK